MLPNAVRQHVVEAAAELLGTLRPDEIPTPLKRIARFQPRRRGKLGATVIAAQLESDPDFRERVADFLREADPDLAAALDAGEVPPAADPVEVAALAYLSRPSGWSRLVAAARRDIDQSSAMAKEEAAMRSLERLQEQLAQVKAARAQEVDKLRGELRDARGEIAELRRKLHEARKQARREREHAAELSKRLEEHRAAAATAAAASEAELRRLRRRLSDAEAAVETARRAAREGRSADDARLRVLLDALLDTARGLRSELALPATITSPADAVGGVEPEDPGSVALPGRAVDDDNPALLDHLLALPRVHLIVDGYNVTKSGYGELPLADQRTRLLRGLGGLAAQTRAEVTCVFDGAELDVPVAVTVPRGVRVRFSEPGETADELIGRLVRAEPPGRSIVVVSSDQEVADNARRRRARPIPAALLLRRLG